MIQLRFVQTDDLGSKAIEIFSRGWPSHVGALTPDGSELGARSDSVGGKLAGVQIRPGNYETFSRVLELALPCTADQETRFWNFLNAQIGKPYDKTAIVAFPFERDWREPDSWFCSELIAAALEDCGWLPKPLPNEVNEITPRDVLLITGSWAV